jgi:hypothetical protein
MEATALPPGRGRLGVILNESGWLIGKVGANVEDTRLHFVDLGLLLHEAVIRLTQRSIPTVWIAGTYSAAIAEQAAL